MTMKKYLCYLTGYIIGTVLLLKRPFCYPRDGLLTVSRNPMEAAVVASQLQSKEGTMGTSNYHKSICTVHMYSNVRDDQASISNLLRRMPMSF